MPLADFVRYLNAQFPDPPSVLRSPTHFVSEGGQVHALYAGLRLESAFSPMVATRDGRLFGHCARLQVLDEASRRRLDPEIAYAQPRDDQEFIVPDRLVRTLHTLNYLTYRERRRCCCSKFIRATSPALSPAMAWLSRKSCARAD